MSSPASPASPATAPTPAPSPTPLGAAPLRPPTDAILSIEHAAELLSETPSETRDLTSMGLLKYQLIDGERCIWLSDLIAYKRDMARARAEWEADPLNRMPDDTPNPVDVLPEYAHMRL